jgi:putative NADH-flavin reductase
MKILVLGASGRLGRNVVTGLLGQGNQVRAFIHSENLLVPHSELELIHGDVHDRIVVEDAVRGVDAVIATLGSATSPLKDVSSSAMRNLIPAMTLSGIRRIVSVTGSAAWREGEQDSPHPHLRARREQLMRAIPELVLDGEKHIRLLENSELHWTVIRAPMLQGEPKRSYLLSVEPPPPSTLSSYLAAATAVVDQLKSDKWIYAAPFVQ